MALVTIQRSPSASSSPPSSDYGNCEWEEEHCNNRSLSEYYFAVKGFAVLLPKNECQQGKRRKSSCPPADIQGHLQGMLHLLRPGDILQMAVKLESVHPDRVRYLAVAASPGRLGPEECCLIGIDFTCNTPTVGLVLRVLADTSISLDGDGGFSVTIAGKYHIFKPVTVQAMWSALQTLHKESSRAREHHFFEGGFNHDWVNYYDNHITSDQSCINEWNTMDSLESKRPPSPNSLSNKEETQVLIRSKLKEIMMSVDIDEVTSKFIRQRLEEELNTKLFQYKSFIDHEMLTILGQMDSATQVFSHVYLGSEWNASNLQELQNNGVGYILNVTKEIDNFFPGMFDYLNIRVYDDEKTELLKHWDDTFRYIKQAKNKNSKVLVHCKMGISRSASVVIAYAMKEQNLSLEDATELVKKKRSCIKPNQAFKSQLKIYQGILDASRQRHNALWRSKSENNLKSPCATPNKSKNPAGDIPPFKPKDRDTQCLTVPPTPNRRPKSWSPDDDTAKMLFSLPTSDVYFGESLGKAQSLNDQTWQAHVTVEQWDGSPTTAEAINPLLVESPSQELLPSTSVKDRINEIESAHKEISYVAHVFQGQPKDASWQPHTNPKEQEGEGECVPDGPSRNDSWGSFDSAVFVGEREAPSRQSSWGSCDTRVSGVSHLSRNSSFNTKDAPTTRSSRSSAKAQSPPREPPTSWPFTRSLSSSSVIVKPTPPTNYSISRSLSEKRARWTEETPAGKVKKLTRELESKGDDTGHKKALRQRSLSLDRICSAPNLGHVDCHLRSSQTLLSKLLDETEAEAQRLAHEEMGVKLLVNRFETAKQQAQRKKMRPRSEAMANPLPPVPQRKSSLDIGLRSASGLKQSLSWSPSLAAPTCSSQIRQKKQQQGKSHPLSKLVPRDT